MQQRFLQWAAGPIVAGGGAFPRTYEVGGHICSTLPRTRQSQGGAVDVSGTVDFLGAPSDASLLKA